MANKVIKGRDLMLFKEVHGTGANSGSTSGVSFAFATNHTLSLNAETADISSKDHGIWGGSEVTKFSWEIQTENLYTEDNFDSLFDLMLNAEPFKVRFGLKSQNDNSKNVADGDYDCWTSKANGYYEGTVVISSLTANANNGENATYSATFTGAGKIVRVDA